MQVVRGINKHRNKGRSIGKEFPGLLVKCLQLQKRFTDFITFVYHILLRRLPPRSRALLKKLRLPQLAKKLPAFYGTLRFITVFTKAHHFSVFWATQSRSTRSYHISLRPILIIPPIHTQVFLMVSFLWASHQNPVCISLLPARATYAAHLIFLHFIGLNIIKIFGEKCELWRFQLFPAYCYFSILGNYVGYR